MTTSTTTSISPLPPSSTPASPTPSCPGRAGPARLSAPSGPAGRDGRRRGHRRLRYARGCGGDPHRRHHCRPGGPRQPGRTRRAPVPVAGRRPPHPHAVQQRRAVPRPRPGAHSTARPTAWLAGHDRPRQRDPRQGRCRQGQPDTVRALDVFGDQTLVFQGLEWNIPAAEHGTVIVHPGRNEVGVLKEFENTFDGVVNSWTASTAANEQHALEGLDFLAASVAKRRVDDAAFFANHPARKGLDSPHEIRGWRDRWPTSAGGFDWMTSTVSGLWDLLRPGQGVVDHRELRLAPGLPRRRGPERQPHRLRRQRALRRPGARQPRAADDLR